MNQTTHVMLRLLSDDAGLGAPVETQYDRKKKRARKSTSAKLGALATGLTLIAVALIAYLK